MRIGQAPDPHRFFSQSVSPAFTRRWEEVYNGCQFLGINLFIQGTHSQHNFGIERSLFQKLIVQIQWSRGGF